MYKWEREDPAEHMKRFHRADVSWNGLRFQYLTVPDEMWPKVTLKSEELHLREVDSWRDAYRLHIEGYFGNLRQRHHVSVPNNYNILQRYMYGEGVGVGGGGLCGSGVASSELTRRCVGWALH